MALEKSAPEAKGLTKVLNTEFSAENKDQIDYIITLGGDGTLLWAAK